MEDFGALPPSQNAQVHRPEHYSLLALAQIFIISSFFRKDFSPGNNVVSTRLAKQGRAVCGPGGRFWSTDSYVAATACPASFTWVGIKIRGCSGRKCTTGQCWAGGRGFKG